MRGFKTFLDCKQMKQTKNTELKLSNFPNICFPKTLFELSLMFSKIAKSIILFSTNTLTNK